MTVAINGTSGLILGSGSNITFPDNSTQGTAGLTGFRNKIINGNFVFAQRATSSGPFSGAASGYSTVDRWFITRGAAGDTATVQQIYLTTAETETVGGGTYSGYRYSASASDASATGRHSVTQAIEYARTLSGKTVTVSFWAKADAARSIALELYQYMGNGGTPSPDVAGIGVTKFNLTTAWAKYSFTTTLPSLNGKTLGTNNNDYLGLHIWFSAGSSYNSRTNTLGVQTGTFDLTNVQVEEGSYATPWENRTPAVEQILCYRFYQKTYLRSVIVQSNYCGLEVDRRVPMRTTPAVTYADNTFAASRFSCNAANGLVVGAGGIVQDAFRVGCDVILNSVPAGASWWAANFYSDAEL